MSHLLELARQGTALIDTCAQAPKVAEAARLYVESALNMLLLSEGPPVEPLAVSEDHRRGIVRTEKGRAVAVAETWLTPPWRCLLIETPSIAMGRPVFLPKRDLAGKKFLSPRDVRVVTDSRSQRAMRRIVEACRSLEIASPVPERSAVHVVFGTYRTFIAWRERASGEAINSSLQGDVDNMAKTILDGLQLAGVLRNDTDVVKLSAAKSLPEGWDAPPPSLEDTIRQEASRRREEGHDFEQIRAAMRLSRAHMARLFPGEYRPRQIAQRRNPEREAFLAREAAGLILDNGVPYQTARRQLRVTATALRKVLSDALRPRVLSGELSLEALARLIQAEPTTARRIFSGDTEALQLLRTTRAPSRSSRRDATRALDSALADVEGGMSTAAAARKHQVSVGSLRVKITRRKVARKRRQGREARR